MIATQNQNADTEAVLEIGKDTAIKSIHTNSSPLLLPKRMNQHAQTAGINPVVDAAAYLFSVLGKLKQLSSYRQLSKLQTELIQEINHFQEAVQNLGYNHEYVMVCRYVLCCTFDDLISNTAWGAQGQWQAYSLLSTLNPDTQQDDKFFTLMERVVKDAATYIDLMELMYICLSLGYKGQYRATEHSQYQLEQMTHHLYQHIRAYRGNFSKTLSPAPFKILKPAGMRTSNTRPSFLLAAVISACIVMAIFVSLGYFMDIMSNEAYKNITTPQKSVSVLSPRHLS